MLQLPINIHFSLFTTWIMEWLYKATNWVIEKSHKQYKSDAQSFTIMKLLSLSFQIGKYK